MSEWVRRLILATKRVEERPSRYKDDLAYWVNGREIAHFEADGVLDLRLTRAVIRSQRPRLKADPRVQLRPGSDWATLDLRASTPDDATLVTELINLTITANTPGRPP